MGMFDITSSSENMTLLKNISVKRSENDYSLRNTSLEDEISNIRKIISTINNKNLYNSSKPQVTSQDIQPTTKNRSLSNITNVSHNKGEIYPSEVSSIMSKCYFINLQISKNGVNKSPTYLPVIPDEISDQISSTWSDTTIVGRSSPVSAYIGTSYRSVNFSFDLHEDMINDKGITIKNILSKLRATVYPEYDKSSVSVPPITFFRFGEFVVRGIVRSVGFNWKKPLNVETYGYKVCTVSISIDGVSQGVVGASNVYNNSPMNPYNNTETIYDYSSSI